MKRVSKQKSKSSKNQSNFIPLTIIENLTGIKTDKEGNEIQYIIKKDIHSKIKAPIYDIGVHMQLLNSKGKHYKDRFIVHINNMGMVMVKGDFHEFQDKLKTRDQQIIQVKGFSNKEQ